MAIWNIAIRHLPQIICPNCSFSSCFVSLSSPQRKQHRLTILEKGKAKLYSASFWCKKCRLTAYVSCRLCCAIFSRRCKVMWGEANCVISWPLLAFEVVWSVRGVTMCWQSSFLNISTGICIVSGAGLMAFALCVELSLWCHSCMSLQLMGTKSQSPLEINWLEWIHYKKSRNAAAEPHNLLTQRKAWKTCKLCRELNINVNVKRRAAHLSPPSLFSHRFLFWMRRWSQHHTAEDGGSFTKTFCTMYSLRLHPFCRKIYWGSWNCTGKTFFMEIRSKLYQMSLMTVIKAWWNLRKWFVLSTVKT